MEVRPVSAPDGLRREVFVSPGWNTTLALSRNWRASTAIDRAHEGEPRYPEDETPVVLSPGAFALARSMGGGRRLGAVSRRGPTRARTFVDMDVAQRRQDGSHRVHSTKFLIRVRVPTEPPGTACGRIPTSHPDGRNFTRPRRRPTSSPAEGQGGRGAISGRTWESRDGGYRPGCRAMQRAFTSRWRDQRYCVGAGTVGPAPT